MERTGNRESVRKEEEEREQENGENRESVRKEEEEREQENGGNRESVRRERTREYTELGEWEKGGGRTSFPSCAMYTYI